MNDLLEIHVDLAPNVASIRLCGELDISNVRLVDRVCAGIPANISDIRFDLSALEYIDSSGLTLIAACARRSAPGRVTVVAPRASTQRLLDVTGLSAILNIVDTVPT
ncbi:MAG: STAS domain-containing protein [Candidatus Eremiobacteraeota bacterium]|nr:STAS domain-containing protein [Candidatus Eremiobacteraeota bacterium]